MKPTEGKVCRVCVKTAVPVGSSNVRGSGFWAARALQFWLLILFGDSYMKLLLLTLLLTVSSGAVAGWIEYSVRSNGDIHFYDDTRIEKNGDEINIWTRIRYKTSVMAASSYQSLLRLDCSSNTETILQSTFFTDKDWAKPAMATNMNPKPVQAIQQNSASAQLASILCNDK
jgi:hypothetical protein